MWFSETGHFERRPIPVRTTINPRHQLPHDQSRCITCTLYCHVGQAWYSPQTTDFMCHDEDVAKLSWPRYEASLGRLIFVFDRVCVCGPAGCSGEGCHKFHVFNRHQQNLQLHPRQVHWATLLQAVSERIAARPTSGVSGPHKFHVSNRHKNTHDRSFWGMCTWPPHNLPNPTNKPPL